MDSAIAHWPNICSNLFRGQRVKLAIINIFFLGTFISCGQGFQKETYINASEKPGDYYANLKSINNKLGNYNGWARFTIIDDQFWARLKVTGPPDIQTSHPQYVTVGGRCPTLSDDLNRDGYLDVLETIRVTGAFLLPLDSNLNTRLRGIDNFMRIKKQGFYFYSKSSSLKRMIQDLIRPPFLPDQVMISLRPGEQLNMHKRIILVMGISEDLSLPRSVSSIPGLPANYITPISCGEVDHYFSGL